MCSSHIERSVRPIILPSGNSTPSAIELSGILYLLILFAQSEHTIATGSLPFVSGGLSTNSGCK